MVGLSNDGTVVKIELVGREGCHLCADAELVLAQVCREFEVDYTALSIDEDPQLADLYWERIPVLLIDGEVFDFWRINEQRLRERLSGD